MNDQTLITLSAYADGELDARARTEFEQQLAQHPEWQRELAQFRQIDAAAAKLPVPNVTAKLATLPSAAELRTGCDAPLPQQLVKELQSVPAIAPERYAQLWKNIAARTVELNSSDALRASALADGEFSGDAALIANNPELAREIALWKCLDAAATNLPVPTLSDLAARESSTELAARIGEAQRARSAIAGAPEVQPAVPQISTDKWDGVWKKIETRVSERSARPVSQAGNVVPLPQGHPRRRGSRAWWIASSTLAAAIAVALLLKFLPPTTVTPTAPSESDAAVALELPHPVNERYDITVEYVKGDPVVCYYLKPEERSIDTNRDWRWLPD